MYGSNKIDFHNSSKMRKNFKDLVGFSRKSGKSQVNYCKMRYMELALRIKSLSILLTFDRDNF